MLARTSSRTCGTCARACGLSSRGALLLLPALLVEGFLRLLLARRFFVTANFVIARGPPHAGRRGNAVPARLLRRAAMDRTSFRLPAPCERAGHSCL